MEPKPEPEPGEEASKGEDETQETPSAGESEEEDAKGEEGGEDQPAENAPAKQHSLEDLSSKAVSEFDQMNQGQEQDPKDGEEGSAIGSQPQAGQRPNIPEALVDQILNRVESNPGRLLGSQFLLEERRAWEFSQRQLIETRPW
ncbi:hypothetical protein [Candidatus Venteria ishoeyi]|nr:hypothetical protein [Candidatus Venteria ishoeyi]SEH04280.1 Uncharacterised protein [Candidatus Venteria ishoeyi]